MDRTGNVKEMAASMAFLFVTVLSMSIMGYALNCYQCQPLVGGCEDPITSQSEEKASPCKITNSTLCSKYVTCDTEGNAVTFDRGCVLIGFCDKVPENARCYTCDTDGCNGEPSNNQARCDQPQPTTPKPTTPPPTEVATSAPPPTTTTSSSNFTYFFIYIGTVLAAIGVSFAVVLYIMIYKRRYSRGNNSQ